MRAGLRAALRYRDGARGQPVAVLSTVPPASAGKSRELPPLLIDVEANLADTFLAPRSLVHATPDQDLTVDIAGDGLKERVLLYGPLLVALGPHYRDGKAFDWLDLGARVVHLDVRDVTGDGKDDLLILRQVTTTDGITREAFEILSFAGGAPASVFAHEVRIARDGEHGRREVVDFVHAGKGVVDVGPEKATGWDASSFDVEPAASMDPILLPWAGTSESYRFDGKKFVRRPTGQGPLTGRLHFQGSQPGSSMLHFSLAAPAGRRGGARGLPASSADAGAVTAATADADATGGGATAEPGAVADDGGAAGTAVATTLRSARTGSGAGTGARRDAIQAAAARTTTSVAATPARSGATCRGRRAMVGLRDESVSPSSPAVDPGISASVSGLYPVCAKLRPDPAATCPRGALCTASGALPPASRPRSAATSSIVA